MGFIVKNQRRYLDAWTSGSNVKLSYRNEAGRKCTEVIEDYAVESWYFYIKRFDYEKLDPEVVVAFEKNELSIIRDEVRFEIEDKEWVRVYVRNDNINERYSNRTDDRLRVKRLLEKEGIKIFEGDLKAHKRYCLDENIQIATDFKVLYYDIEIDDRNPGIVVGRDRILTIAGVDQSGKEFFFHDEDEKVMLEQFYELVRWDYDILVGYNSDNFDMPYIEKRMRHEHYMEDEAAFFKYRMTHIDLMKVFLKRFAGDSDITSWSLEFISQYFLGHGKMEGGPTFGQGRGYQYYLDHFNDFKKYNIMDCRNLYDLNQTLSIIDQIILECQITGAFPSKCSISEMLDCYILRSVRGKGIHFNSIEYGENQVRCPACNHMCSSEVPIEEIVGEMECMRCKERFEPNSEEDIIGAHVFEPVPGLHDDVYVFDYKALYPSIIRTFNIGPDTFLEKVEYETVEQHDKWNEFVKTANDQYYTAPDVKVSAIKGAVERLLKLRKQYKNKMLTFKPGTNEYKAFNAKQNAVKMLCNSVYGLMGYQYGRFYRKEIAEAITLGGQWLNKQTKVWFEERGHPVIYGDTDSVFVKGTNIDRIEVDNLLIELHEFYDEALNDYFGVQDHFIELEYEKRFSRLLLLKKKHYVGQLDELDGEAVDKFIVKGIECIKRDTIPLGKKWQRELVESLILEDKSMNYYVNWVQGLQKKFFNNEFELEDIVIRKKLTKHPSRYKTTTPHAILATEMMDKEMECYVGMPIPYIVIDEKPIVAVHPDWYENNASIPYYWDQQIYGIIRRVLEVAYPSFDWAQFSTKIAIRRDKRTQQFLKWFDDPKKKRPALLEKLRECKVLSPQDKLAIKKKVGIKVFKKKEIYAFNSEEKK